MAPSEFQVKHRTKSIVVTFFRKCAGTKTNFFTKKDFEAFINCWYPCRCSYTIHFVVIGEIIIKIFGTIGVVAFIAVRSIGLSSILFEGFFSFKCLISCF